MNSVIYRTVGQNTHFLNVSSGDIKTFEIQEEDALYLFQNWTNLKLELSEEVLSLFSAQGNNNTRLCRENLNILGMDSGFPTMVNLEINRRCSLRCIHCYIGEEYLKSAKPSIFERMSLGELNSFVNELGMMGVFLLVFTGGEPFLNSRLAQLIEMANREGFVVEIFSNLQFIPSWFREMEPSSVRVGRIQTSVYSSNPAVHDSITRVQGSYRRTMKSLEFLVAKGFYLEVSTPLMSQNYETWKDTRKLFSDLGIRQDFSWPIVDEYYPERTGKSGLNISPAQFKHFVRLNPDFLIKTDLRDSESPICEAGRSLFCVSAEGDIFPCSQLTCSTGNITKESVSSIYASKKMQRFRDLRGIDTQIDSAYNYCIGGNYSGTGNVLIQPEFFLASIEAAIGRK